MHDSAVSRDTSKRPVRRSLAVSIQSRFLLLLLIILVPIMLVQTATYYDRYQGRRELVELENIEMARTVADGFEAFTRSVFSHELAIGKTILAAGGLSRGFIEEILDATREDIPCIRSVCWVGPDGRIVDASDPDAIGIDISDRPYFKEIAAGRDRVVSDLSPSKVNGDPILTICRGIRDGNGNLSGVVMAVVDPEKLDLLFGMKRRSGGVIALLDSRGMLTYIQPAMKSSWEDRNWLKRYPAIKHAFEGREFVTTLSIPHLEQRRIIAFAPTTSTGWVVAAGLPEDMVMSRILPNLVMHGGIFLAVSFLAFLTALFISRKIGTPIKVLHEQAVALGRGEASRPVTITGPIELRELANAFNNMADEIRARENSLIEMRNSLEVRVKKRTRDLQAANEALKAEIVERKKAEAMLRLDDARLEALWEFSRMTEASMARISEFALDRLVGLTGSTVGLIAFLDEAETALTVHHWSRSAVEQCSLADKPAHLGDADTGLWANAIRNRKPVILNDYSAHHPDKKGYPPGHVSLSRVMLVPILDGERITAVTAVANKPEEYDTADLRQSVLLMDGMWKIIQRRNAEKALREAENLAAMGRALSALAHDIKTPLIAIGGFTRLVQRRLDPRDNSEYDKLGIVLKETERLEKMVNNMLDFSRPLKLECSPVELDRLSEECLSVVEPVAHARNVTVRLESPPDLQPILLDSARMRQALINLMVNAVQASPEGDAVLVAIHRKYGQTVVEIVDHGPGVPGEMREEIFIPFVTSKKDGTGLGLPVVKKVVEAHGGHVRVLDTPGGGATFRVELPSSASPPH